MLIVAPRGRTKDETCLSPPNSSTHFMLIGSVPTDEAEEKANMMAGIMPLKNLRGLMPPIAETDNE